jgi:hypothetical protein
MCRLPILRYEFFPSLTEPVLVGVSTTSHAFHTQAGIFTPLSLPIGYYSAKGEIMLYTMSYRRSLPQPAALPRAEVGWQSWTI